MFVTSSDAGSSGPPLLVTAYSYRPGAGGTADGGAVDLAGGDTESGAAGAGAGAGRGGAAPRGRAAGTRDSNAGTTGGCAENLGGVIAFVCGCSTAWARVMATRLPSSRTPTTAVS